MNSNRVSLFVFATALTCLVMSLGGCGDYSKRNQVSQSGAKQATVIQVPLNSKGNTCEQQNVLDRIKATTDPTKVMWIHLITLDGKIIQRMAVRNKVSSSGKRLEPTQATGYAYNAGSSMVLPTHNGYATPELIQPDGTYGSSDSYIFWFDPTGRYHQYGTAGGIGYLLTDYPISLSNPIEEMTGLYNADKAATDWQAEQEAKLKSTEKK